MPATPPRFSAASLCRTVCALVFCALTACNSSKPAAPGAAAPHGKRDPELAAARIDLAKSRLSANAADEALALLVSALEADPQSTEAGTMAAMILGRTRWSIPETIIHHPLPVDRIEFGAPSMLWVSLTGGTDTMVRWNLETMSMESVLFPVHAAGTRSLVFDAAHHSVVVERGGVTLLCDAQTLKPVRDLGATPDFLTPSSVIAYSTDGLLLAHPSFVSDQDHSLVWHLRDATTGQVIRNSESIAADRPAPLAAFLDRKKLSVLNADGSVMEMPVSPVEPVVNHPPAETARLLSAQFAVDGGSALALRDMGPHRTPELCVWPPGPPVDPALSHLDLLERFSWNRHPGLWTGLLRNPAAAPLAVDGRTAVIRSPDDVARICCGSEITALARAGEHVITGEQDGTLTIHRTMPTPLGRKNADKAAIPDDKTLAALRELTECLAGVRYDAVGRTFERCDADSRCRAFKECDFDAVLRVFPSLDFSPVVTMLRSLSPRTVPVEALQPLRDRLARSDASGAPPTRLLENTFDRGDDAAIKSAIQAAGAKGPAAAKALELALASTHPEWIETCLAQAADLPPLLKAIAISRISWLRDRKAEALAGWPDVFPDMEHVRQREDWDGWEQADFSQALEKLRLCVTEELAAIEVPENPSPEQRQAVAERLADPATVKAVGRARFAKACLKAALALSAFKDQKETTFKLASLARDLGEAPEPCLRAEAMALTALGDYKGAHERWITLITEHPVQTQQPGDYAEASYTAFETADPRQAMAILTTGLHRFPNDANFALRAGWVALLTGNAERAYRFLLTGRQIGYPPEKLENATALLAIAAAQTGATEDAAAFYQDLVALDADWKKPETIDSLDWPEELKASLRQLTW